MTAELVDTPSGPARLHLDVPEQPRGVLVLGHGAGGGLGAKDLLAAAGVARELGLAVALVEQPYRVAGRRAPVPAPRLDAAWASVVARVRTVTADLPLVAGGRSSGARVACRTAAEVGAVAVLCLAFPLQPPRERPSRLPELDAVGVPALVVQGTADPFGVPPPGTRREVAVIPGNHSLSTDVGAVRSAVRAWLEAVLAG